MSSTTLSANPCKFLQVITARIENDRAGFLVYGMGACLIPWTMNPECPIKSLKATYFLFCNCFTSFFFPVHIWDRTICPWVWSSVRHSQNGTTLWDTRDCRNRSFPRKKLDDISNMSVRSDLPACPERLKGKITNLRYMICRARAATSTRTRACNVHFFLTGSRDGEWKKRV